MMNMEIAVIVIFAFLTIAILMARPLIKIRRMSSVTNRAPEPHKPQLTHNLYRHVRALAHQIGSRSLSEYDKLRRRKLTLKPFSGNQAYPIRFRIVRHMKKPAPTLSLLFQAADPCRRRSSSELTMTPSPERRGRMTMHLLFPSSWKCAARSKTLLRTKPFNSFSSRSKNRRLLIRSAWEAAYAPRKPGRITKTFC